MKIHPIAVIFLLLNMPLLAAGQKHSFRSDSALVSIITGLPGKEPFDTAQPWDKAVGDFLYVISDHDLYDYFGYQLAQSYRHIDFQQYHILGSRQCINCIRNCQAESSRCHRNACQYEWVWFLRDNAKALDSLESVSSKEEENGRLPDGNRWWGEDTVLQSTGREKEMHWLSRVGGDCHATFEFRLYRDRHYAVYLLKELNYDGGCRAGGGWLYSTKFRSPDGNVQFVRRTLLLPNKK